MIPCWLTVTVEQGVSLIDGQVGQVIVGHEAGSSVVGQSHDSVGGYMIVGQLIVGHVVGASYVGQSHDSVVIGSSQVGEGGGGSVPEH